MDADDEVFDPGLVAAGSAHSVLSTIDGDLWAWGRMDYTPFEEESTGVDHGALNHQLTGSSGFDYPDGHGGNFGRGGISAEGEGEATGGDSPAGGTAQHKRRRRRYVPVQKFVSRSSHFVYFHFPPSSFLF